MEKLSLREVKSLGQGQLSMEGYSQHLNPAMWLYCLLLTFIEHHDVPSVYEAAQSE